MADLLGIDLGTSGCRAVVIDGDGAERAVARVPWTPPRVRDGRAEQDPEVWWRGLEAALDELAAGGALARVRALAVDGTSATVLLAGPEGRPLGPALMYNDARATDQAAAVARHAPPTSGAHGASSGLAKLLWLLDQAPAAEAAHVLHQADWITGRLTDRHGMSDENNALKLGYDPVTRQWPDWLDALGVPRTLLPGVLAPGTPVGPLAHAASARWGLPADAVVAAGTTDGIAGFLAAAALTPGTAVTALGSTLVLKVVAERPVFEPAAGIYSHRLGDLWLAGGASNTGGAVLRHFFSDEALATLSTRLRPDHPTGLGYYPLLSPGERFPVSDPDLAPRLEPRPADDAEFLQGLLEAMAEIEAAGYRKLAELGAPYPTTVMTVGGGAVNEAWTGIRHRALRVPVTAAEHAEAAYGAAVVAGWAIGQR